MESCSNCPLKKNELLLLNPKNIDSIKIMTVTEGPNKREPIEIITSFANHPTFTFLFSLFKGNYNPIGENANVYWTHVRKCFLQEDKTSEKGAGRLCEKYLQDEISALKPSLIVAVGKSAYRAITGDKTKLLDVIQKERTNTLIHQTDEIRCELAVLPHPSGLNVFWNDISIETFKTLTVIQKRILKYV